MYGILQAVPCQTKTCRFFPAQAGLTREALHPPVVSLPLIRACRPGGKGAFQCPSHARQIEVSA